MKRNENERRGRKHRDDIEEALLSGEWFSNHEFVERFGVHIHGYLQRYKNSTELVIQVKHESVKNTHAARRGKEYLKKTSYRVVNYEKFVAEELERIRLEEQRDKERRAEIVRRINAGEDLRREGVRALWNGIMKGECRPRPTSESMNYRIATERRVGQQSFE